MAEKKIESEKPNEKPVKNNDFVWFFGFYVYFRDCTGASQGTKEFFLS